MKKLTGIVAILLLMIFSSCQKDGIRGSGNTTTETRTVADFTGVQSNGDINVHITYGTTPKIEVKGYENLVAITETKVVNNKLIIKYSDEYSNVRNSNIEVNIVIGTINNSATNGSGNIWIDGFTNGTNLTANVNGSSDINVTNSSYETAVFDVNGSGNIKAAGLSTKNTEITIHGSGDVEITCSQNLKAKISGSGDIRYWGSPVLEVEVSGSGKVIKQ